MEYLLSPLCQAPTVLLSSLTLSVFNILFLHYPRSPSSTAFSFFRSRVSLTHGRVCRAFRISLKCHTFNNNVLSSSVPCTVLGAGDRAPTQVSPCPHRAHFRAGKVCCRQTARRAHHPWRAGGGESPVSQPTSHSH